MLLALRSLTERTAHRALTYTGTALQEIPVGLEGTGLKPLVILPDGTLRLRQTTEGKAVVYARTGVFRTVPPVDTLIT